MKVLSQAEENTERLKDWKTERLKERKKDIYVGMFS